MKLLDIVHRQRVPKPWAEGEKIPWHDPEFSRRMLKEHLSQEHDAASRRFESIDRCVRWMHDEILDGKRTQILDLGCGPGLYTNRLARLGHQCVGIDFSPASIAYAREQAEGLECEYIQQDIRVAEFDGEYGLVMMIFGEFNVFRPEEAKGIVKKAYAALAPGGYLLLEPYTFEGIVKIGQAGSSWDSSEEGLFSDEPHVYLQENFWDAGAKVAINRYYIVDAETGTVTRYSSSTQAYTEEEYRLLLSDSGFDEIEFLSSLDGSTDDPAGYLLGILSKKDAG